MPIITIQLTGEPVTQKQKHALISRSTDMIKEILHKDPEITGVIIEEVGAKNWGTRGHTVTHRFKSPKEYERCLINRWQLKKT